MTIHNIAIIGAGIGGLAAAIFLARHGYSVTIYEQAEQAQPVGAGFLLQPPGQVVLDQLGVLDSILQDAVPILGLQSKTVGGYSILDLDYRNLKGSLRHGLGVQRRTIHDALYRAAAALDGIHFRWGHTVDHCLTTKRHATVTANERTDQYELCIIASGANSDLANTLFERRRRRAYAWGCIWTTIDLPASLSPTLLHQRCQRADRMMGILPVLKDGDGYRAALYWSVKVADVAQLNADQTQTIKSEITDFWPEAAASVEPLGHDDFIAATYRDVWTPTPFDRRVVAIGDACHATSPQLGQGCTMALLDAYWLSHHLLQADDEIDAALGRWWQTRKRQLQYVRQLSRFLTPLYQSDNGLFATFRNAVVAPMGKLPGFYGLQLKTLASEVFLRQIDQ